MPAGWRLYLPEDWCGDQERRALAKIPDHVVFQTKPEIATDLVEQIAGWQLPRAPVLADPAYGRDVMFRERLHAAELEYLVAVSTEIAVYPEQTRFEVPPARGPGHTPTIRRADEPSLSVKEIAATVPTDDWQTIQTTTPTGKKRESTVSLHRVYAKTRVVEHRLEPRLETLLIEKHDGQHDYWLSNLPADTPIEQLVHLAHLRWQIELDYKELKDDLGLDHYEGRSYTGWHHHTALVTAAHAFLTEERRLRPRP